MSFASLGLSEALVRAIEAAGYTQPTPVQQRAIPAVLQGRDLMVAAQTGTGKTAGFALPILERLFPEGHPDKSRRHGPRQPRVLVLTPTRELAAQVHDSFKIYARDLKFVSAVVFGGVGMNPQVQALAKGVDVLVACPGRLLDLAGQGSVDLSHVEILVLDEADRMLDMGFIHDVKKVLARLPEQRQNLLFSATFSKDITDLAEKLLHNPERIEVTPPNTTVERIEQRVFRLQASHKRALLAHLITQGAWEQVLVFTRTKHGANRLAEYLNKHGLTAAPIHGNKSQNARTKALADFKAGTVRVMVATDIAARGLDIDQLPHVVNFELPNVEEDYVHRIGRTGRAGRSGEAISLVAPDEEKLLKSIERMTRQRIPDGDAMGFDASTIEAEKPEVREPRQPQGRGRGQGANNNGGRKDKPRKDKPKEKAADQPAGESRGEKPASGERPAGERRNRRQRGGKKPAAQGQAAAPSLPADRDPEEFRDDEVDNFGNRADYVSPYKDQKPGSRNRRPAGGQAQNQGQGQQRRQGQGQAQGAPRSNGSGAKAGNNNRRGSNGGGQGRRDGGSRRVLTGDAPRGESMIPSARQDAPKPKIIHKESRLSSLTLEQLDELQRTSKPRGEKPALLTRGDS
ncbi:MULTISPECIES: DEAD/DEAH box helicase [unclassified Pseudomonas]|uniref:DEAD/DEAH box helicase n=1 Tax=unclassified Pseudomonas TaxID=196821 RepID=UPI000BCE6652|nr:MULTISPECIES: DEAD/DEAH box helicase [unclassified Pseudomonas]PVZ15557.1 ATP-dependent RNA helicase RhlE [Pseudomonas sp. URIL14HWK12:I12]PVZ24931.1 ATP-dependent RNA helicase RhlE [Pseudomonas sp. URIL14HWK12:I10]PVZ34777.1 ATP-dependent RNA helicase RhlE [Pseudomonas sp. URIL14HWK12:I11]SNZ09267.1 ATP-dependent RNA helicase RhlE [Pseudomonas sp. URIL14HWK12:I9]